MGEPLGMTNGSRNPTDHSDLADQIRSQLRDLGYRVNDNNDRQNSRMLSISDPDCEDHQIIELSFARTPFTVTFSRFTLQGVVDQTYVSRAVRVTQGILPRG